MANTVISIENISKSYQLGVIGTGTFRGDVQRWWAKLRGKPDPFLKIGQDERRNLVGETIWALKDIDFTVQQGNAVGIIGRNGAGKSTLLKILSQVTAPTSGEVKVRGRMASLLEVGTGFHPELTGRENIFLNGAILGMSRREIERKFDEIVDFSGVETYIDTPVKRYSSGMYVRLAFAVAAHLEPDILIVDEVLAVGDVAFQKKCLGKMEDVTKGGRTILFVSHNMAAIENLCTQGVYLDEGKVKFLGATNDAVQFYLREVDGINNIPVSERKDRQGNGALRVTELTFRDPSNSEVKIFRTGDDVVIDLQYESVSPTAPRNVTVSLAIDSHLGQRVAVVDNGMAGFHFESIDSRGIIRCQLPNLPLAAGRYYLTFFITVNGIIADWVMRAAILEVEASDFYNTGRYPHAHDGYVLLQQKWKLLTETSA